MLCKPAIDSVDGAARSPASTRDNQDLYLTLNSTMICMQPQTAGLYEQQHGACFACMKVRPLECNGTVCNLQGGAYFWRHAGARLHSGPLVCPQCRTHEIPVVLALQLGHSPHYFPVLSSSSASIHMRCVIFVYILHPRPLAIMMTMCLYVCAFLSAVCGILLPRSSRHNRRHWCQGITMRSDFHGQILVVWTAGVGGTHSA